MKRFVHALALAGLCTASPVVAQDPGSGGEIPPDGEQRMLEDFGLRAVEPTTSAVRTSSDPQRLVYDGAPLSVTVAVGRERRLIFDQALRLSVDPAVSDAFEPEIYGRNLLLRVTRPLATRLHVRLADGQVVPVDLHALKGSGPIQPIEIVRRERLQAQAGTEPAVPDAALAAHPVSPSYIDLVRYAAQRLYAPERLIEERAGVSEAPVGQNEIRLIRFGQVATRPIAGWAQGGLFVTAVRVTNLQDVPVLLDPRRIVGRFRAAAFQHHRLPARAETALYLVSDRPFGEALGPVAGEGF